MSDLIPLSDVTIPTQPVDPGRPTIKFAPDAGGGGQMAPPTAADFAADDAAIAARERAKSGEIPLSDITIPPPAPPTAAPAERSFTYTALGPLNAPANALQGFTEQFGRAATLGLQDKVGAAASAVKPAIDSLTGMVGRNWLAQNPETAAAPSQPAGPSIGDAYQQELARERGAGEAYATNHPVASKVASTLGTVATVPLTAGGGVPAAPTLGGRMLQNAGPGAALGALAGFGGTNDKSLAQTAIDTGLGAATGGVIGAAAPVVAEHVVQPVIDWAARTFGTGAIENQAVRQITQRIRQDAASGGPSAQDMLDLVNAAAPNKPVTLADFGGENLRARAGALARQPAGRQLISQTLNQRDVGAGTRLAGDVDSALGAGSSYDTAQALMQARRAAAGPAYDAAYAAAPLNPDTLQPSGPLNQLMGRPSMRDAARRAVDLAAEEGRDPASLGIAFNQAGNPTFERVPSWQTLDYVKRGLDDVVEQYRDPTSGRLVLDTRGNAMNGTRSDFLNFLDRENPAYAAARASFAGPSQSLSAMRQGQTVFSRRPEEVAADLTRLAPGDQEFYRLGAADALRTRIAQTSSGGDEARRIIGSQYIQDQLRPLFPNQAAYDRFINAATTENRMFQTRYDILGNSRTAARMAEDQAGGGHGALGNALQTGAAMMEGAPIAATMSGIRTIGSLARSAGENQAVNAAAARALFSTDPAANRALLARIIAGQNAPSMLPSATVPLASLASRLGPALLQGR